jgi:acetylornithine deacetylase/succinyl-diaminopimelate desuccinylase-like protein
MGGTVPVTTMFREMLGVDTVFFSFSTADEDIHAPNEFYRPERFRLGLQAWAKLWTRLNSRSSRTTNDPPPSAS